MYLPSHFEETRPDVLRALILQHPLGLLVTTDATGAPVANPIPFLLVVFQGPDGYISPSGYPSKAEHGKVVPTWNYAMVQARGPLWVMEEATLKHAIVSRLTNHHEAGRAKPWGVGDAPDDYIAMMLRAIVGIEIPVASLVGKYKLSQNRSAADRAGVTSDVQAHGGAALADWMTRSGAAG